MRSSKRFSVIALVAVAAGLSLTACGPDNSSASGTTSSPSTSDAPGTTLTTSSPSATGSQDGSSGSGSSGSSDSTSGGSSGSTGTPGGNSGGTSGVSGSSNSGSGSGSAGSSGRCKTSNLAVSAVHGPSGEGMELVNFTNIGQTSCTMHGFAGVELKGSGNSVDVPRRDPGNTPTIKLAPGQGNGFSLYYPLNDGNGGFTYTTMVITPPNETHSKSLGVSIDVPVATPDQGYATKEMEIYAVGTTR